MLQLTIVLLVLGASLLIAEIFAPGFGFLGISGIVVSIISFVITALCLPGGSIIVTGEIALFALLIFIVFKYMKKSQVYNKIILTETLNEDTPAMENFEYFLGKEGVTMSSLRPFGDVDFNGHIVNVFSEGNYIPENRKVKVVRVEGNRIIVVKSGN